MLPCKNQGQSQNVPPEPPEANAGKADDEAGAAERSQGFGRGFMRALLGTADGFGGSSLMSVRMFGGVSPFSSICKTYNPVVQPHWLLLQSTWKRTFSDIVRQSLPCDHAAGLTSSGQDEKDGLIGLLCWHCCHCRCFRLELSQVDCKMTWLAEGLRNAQHFSE